MSANLNGIRTWISQGIPGDPPQGDPGSRWVLGATPIMGKQIRHLKVVQQMSHSTGVLTKKRRSVAMFIYVDPLEQNAKHAGGSSILVSNK